MTEQSGDGQMREPEGEPREKVTEADYQAARSSLQTFVEKDSNGIDTLADLASDIKVVGKALEAVILSRGKMQELEFQEDGQQKGTMLVPVIKEPEGNGEVFATVSEGTVHIGHHRTEGGVELSNFSVAVPVARDMRSIDDPALLADAFDARRGPPGDYFFPLQFSKDPHTLRGYARMVQDGVRAVLHVAKPPSQQPPPTVN